MYRSIVFALLAAAGAVTAARPVLAYDVVAVADGGAVEGKIVFRETRPPMKKVVPTKNPEVCGATHDEPQIVLTADGGVQDAIVFLKQVKAGKAWGDVAKHATLDNQACHYVPRTQVLPVGSTLDISNSDPILHTVHGFAGTDTLFNKALWKAKVASESLATPGLVRVDCDVHGWMRAWVYVVDSPYYAITGKDGSFKITDVPPGDYTLVTWHEFTGTAERAVTVKAKESLSITADLKKQGAAPSVVQVVTPLSPG